MVLFFNSFNTREAVSQSPDALANDINLFLNGISPASLVDMQVRNNGDEVDDNVFEWSVQWREGLADYSARVFTFDPSLGTTLDSQVLAFWNAGAHPDTFYPRFMFDLTSPSTRRARLGTLLFIFEQTAEIEDGSYNVGDLEWRTRRMHIVETEEAIAAGASGSVRLISSSGKRLSITATNPTTIALSSGDRAYATIDPTFGTVNLFPNCC